ncbi:hypothetical protein EV702DRAFT_1042208 [Suillus placidus]|uniref:RING-type domain-containing protein n=1 Tax=Suillus placidus TaxID=48579 RepID=A0A9P7A3I1_9AGAM|nr:hypothetical protein EV702DRAFT_1042208 [Suillus placidus]
MPSMCSSSQQRSRPHAKEIEVIVLSSDDENAPSGKIRPSKRKLSVISLSSDEGPMVPKAPRKDGSSRQRENSRLKQMNEQLERQVAGQRIRLDYAKKRLEEQSQELAARSQEMNACHKKIQLQQEKLAALEAKELTIDATELDDTLSCNICTDLMYSPYLLLDCGHSYCEGCLKGWFNETLTKHIRAHPAYNVHRKPVPRDLPQILNIIGPYVSRPIQMQLQALYNNSRQAQPEYTCPACRKEVTGKPVVNFAVKDMVSIVGSVLGRSDTRRESSNIRGRQAGPFDGFFPR